MVDNAQIQLNEATIRQLPKADLHVHLDGSLRIPTLIELSKASSLKLPSETEEGLRELVFKDTYSDLPDYLQGFQYTCAAMQSKEAIERVAYEFAWDCFFDGVLYVEPRYSPELLQGAGLSVEEVILSVENGLKKASEEINLRIKNESSEHKNTAQIKDIVIEKPAFKYSHIICAMRMWDPSQSLNVFIEANRVKEKHNLPILAVDLAGPEEGFPAVDHKDAYTYAHQQFTYKTVHAGEAFGPSSIFQALTQLYADRIGHGFHLFNESLINTENQAKAKKYIENLVQYIAERRITLEVCLTSNLQTMPVLENNIANHSLPKMLEHGLSVAICTDNRLVSNTTVTKELMLAQKTFNLDAKQMKKIIMYGIKRSFYPGNYLEKKQYIDHCSSYCDYLLGDFSPILQKYIEKQAAHSH